MLAPSLYLERISLIEAAKLARVDPLMVERLLWVTNARPDLVHCGTVFSALLEIVAVAHQHWPGILAEYKLAWMPDALFKTITLVLPLFRSSHILGSGLDGSHDWSTRNALWDALRYSRPKGDDFSTEYKLLQAHYFFAHCATLLPEDVSRPAYEAYGEKKEWPLLKIPALKPARALRNLAEPAEWTDDLLARFRLTKRPLQFAESLGIKVQVIEGNDTSDSWTQRQADDVQNYVRQAYGLKVRYPGRGSSHRPDAQVGDPTDPAFDLGDLALWESELEDDEEDEEDPGGDGQPDRSDGTSRGARHKSGRRETEKQRALALDECPFEDEDESLESWSSREALFQTSPGSFVGAMGAASNQAIRAQKWFPFAYDQLTSCELKIFNVSISFQHMVVPRIYPLLDALQGGIKLSKEQRLADRMPNWHGNGGLSPLPVHIEAEVLLFLLIMLYTGSSFDRTYSLTWLDNLVDPAGPPQSDLEIVQNLETWRRPAVRVRVPFPKYRSIQEPVPGLDCNRVQHVTLPDAAGVSFLVNRYLRLRKKKPDGAPYVFLQKKSFYRTNAELLLKDWDPTQRVTLAKLSRYLYGRIMSQTGNDIVAATMITGQRFSGSRVPMFYACRSESGIQTIYDKAVYAASEDISMERASHGSYEGEAFGDTYTYVGQPSSFFAKDSSTIHIAKRLCPTTTAVREAIARLIRDINKLKGQTGTAQRRTYLDLLALYTYWFFAFSTGARAVIDGFVRPREISELNHTALFHDKGPKSGLKDSLLLMLAPVIQQLEHYAWNVGSDCFITTSSLDLHFIDKDGKPESVRPSTLTRHMADYLPGFPPATHRRFMINALIEVGCPPETARIWMRHAIRGEEPWSMHATLSFSRHRETLSPYLSQILDFVGFVPLDK